MKFFLALLVLGWTSHVAALAEVDHRQTMKIDREVKIIPAGTAKRSMMSLAAHPDGSLYLNAQTSSPTLFKSSDRGETWKAVPSRLAVAHQVVQGLGVNRKGRLFLVHQTSGDQPPNRPKSVDAGRRYGQDLFVSYSDDGGWTWTNSGTDFTRFGPGTPNISYHEDGNRTFIEQPDGTLLFTTTLVSSADYKTKYPPGDPMGPPNYEYGGRPEDLFSDLVFRSTDGGRTWGQPTQVYPDLNPHESALAIGPQDKDRILIMTRIQRLGRPDEDAEMMMKQTGNPKHYYKQGALFESGDGGRTFRLSQGGMTEYYGHRGTLSWSKRNVVVVTHQWGDPGDTRKVARISLDGGRTWVDGTRSGTKQMNQSTKFVLAHGVGFTAPTVELSPGRFLTAVYHYSHLPEVPENLKGVVGGIHWHLEKVAE